MYKILKTDGRAKRAEFTTVHGTVQTPVFMNVGTVAAIKGAVATTDLQQIGTQIELSNTYHLHVRPGDKIIKQLGGLHKFMTEEEIAKARWEAEVYSKQDEAYQRFIDIREDAVRTLNEANNALAANKKVWEKDKKKNVKAQIGHLGKLISKAPIDKLNEEKAASMHEASEAVKEALR